jgi:hypothetical protein
MTTENQKPEATNPDAQSGLSSASLFGGWKYGNPPKEGYYIAAWEQPHRHRQRLCVSELLYIGNGEWSVIRPYFFMHVAQNAMPNESNRLKELVVAWMPLPNPPNDLSQATASGAKARKANEPSN